MNILNFPFNSGEPLEQWRRDGEQCKAAEQREVAKIHAKQEQRQADAQAVQQQIAEDWDARFQRAFAAATAEGPAFDETWAALIREAFSQFQGASREHLDNVMRDQKAMFDAASLSSSVGSRSPKRGLRPGRRERRNTVNPGWRWSLATMISGARMTDALAVLNRESEDHVERMIDAKVTSLAARVDKALQVDAVRNLVADAISASALAERTERRHDIGSAIEIAHSEAQMAVAELEREAGADRARITELERRLDTAAGLASAAEFRARKLEEEAAEERAQLRDDAIKIGDDLRKRVRDTVAVVGAETRDMLETKFSSRLAESEKRAEEAEERARVAETALTEVRGFVRNDLIRLSDDLRERMREAAAAPAAELWALKRRTRASTSMTAPRRAS